ncbi:S1 family peptidase [Actinomadura scrupuli]|uniref:S1 family peptidase n=1 Tax=Actinomadura scrupuli TaxID=559629 RepID=UPI003D9641EC
MNPKRLVDVRAGNAERTFGSGSGYLIGPSLVLTARHVLVDEDDRPWERVDVRIGVPADGPPQHVKGARMCWHRGDVALLEIDPGPAPGPAVQWGRPITTMPLDYRGLGFPSFAGRYEGDRGVEELQGVIQPLSFGAGPTGRLYALDQSAFPDDRSDWGGASGAAVFHGRLLIGVLVLSPGHLGGRRLGAVPAHDFVSDPGFVRLVTAGTGAAPLAEPVELSRFFDVRREPVRAATPGSLLDASVRAVSFTETARADGLYRWRDDPDLAFSVRLMTGGGGEGKTRLAQRLAELSRGSGWVTGFADDDWPIDPDRPDPADLTGVLEDSTADVLIVIDHADRHQELVLSIGRELVRRSPSSRVRLLLLSRQAGGWWAELRERLGDGVTTEFVLGRLPDTPSSRADIYRRSVRELGVHLGELPYPPVTGPLPDWPGTVERLLADPREPAGESFGRVLSLQTAALVDLLTLAEGGDLLPDDRLEQALVDYEYDYLMRAAERHGLPRGGPLDRALAALILLGPCQGAEARIVASFAEPAPAGQVQSWLRTLYPPPGGYGWELGKVLPSRLGELLLGDILFQRGQEDVPVRLAELTTDRVMARRVLIPLARTATHDRFRDPAEERIPELLATDLGSYSRAALSLLRSGELRRPVAAGMSRYMRRSIVELRDRIAGAAREFPALEFVSHIHEALADTGSEEELHRLAGYQHELAGRLPRGPWLRRAVTEAERSADERRLNGEDPQSFVPEYVETATMLGRVALDDGRFRDAAMHLTYAYLLGRQLPADAQGFTAWAMDELRRTYTAAPEPVAAEYSEITGEPVPGWMKEPPETAE